jgi:quinol monooxygenase YgiN
VRLIAVVWQFEVLADKHEEFEAFYGANGAWTTLSRRSRSFLGSSFLRDLAQPRRYLVVEYWSEMVVYERHHADFRQEMDDLEARRNALLESARAVGVFNALDVPERTGATWSQRRPV